MRAIIKGVILGAVVAAGVSVLLAQTPTWTTPRTWATDDLLTAGQYNQQFRDNLLWLRADATLTGTAALDDLGCGTRGSGEVLYSDCDWAALPAGVVFDIHDDIGTAATIVDSDRIPFSDESVNGDPMRYTLASNLADYMQGEVELSANRITSDTFSTARIPNLSASKITSDTFSTARIPNLSASKITSDTLDNARLSNIPTGSLANNVITQPKMAANAVGPAEMDPESATTGQVMMIGSGGDPAWQFPFEFPRTQTRRDGRNDHIILTSTIERSSLFVSIAFTASVTATQVGTGTCSVLIYRARAGTPLSTTRILNGTGTQTRVITGMVNRTLSRGNAYPVMMYLSLSGLTSQGESCSINAGDASLTLSTP